MAFKTYTIESAAEALNIPVPTLRKFRPELGGSKIGRRWIFTEDELTDFMQRKRSRPLSELRSAS